MKKILALMVIGLLAFTFIGCNSEPEEAPRNENISNGDYPDWFLSPPYADEVIYGVGVAKLSDMGRSKTTAELRATNDISTQVSVFIESMMTDYFQEAGVDGDIQTISMVESMTKQIAEIELNGARTVESYVAADGTFYSLKTYPLNKFVEEEVADIFRRNESAAFAEFKSDEMLELLNQELEDGDGLQSQTHGGY